jgi:hypothetical protein
MSILKKAFTAARLALGKDPLVITAKGIGRKSYDDDEVVLFKSRMVAECHGWLNPKEQYWHISLDTNGESYRAERQFERQYQCTSYNEVLRVLKSLEDTGKRRNVSSFTNVLRYV